MTTEPWVIASTAPTGWGNAGAASVELLEDGINGSVYWTVGSETSTRAFGLSNTNADANYNTIEYAFMLDASNTLYIVELGTMAGSFGSVSEGDVLRIERKNGSVYYQRNGQSIHTNHANDTRSLMVDVALFETSSRFAEIRSTFANELISITTLPEEGVTYVLSGAGTGATFAAGTTIFAQPEWPLAGQTALLTLDLLEGSSDMGFDLQFELTAEGNLTNFLIAVPGPEGIGTFPLPDWMYELEANNGFSLQGTGAGIGIHVTDWASCPTAHRNSVTRIVYDENGLAFMATKEYMYRLGRVEQSQTRDYSKANTLASEPVFDSHGRPVLNSLAAPTDQTHMCFKEDFIQHFQSEIQLQRF